MALSDARRQRLQRIEAAVAAFPGVTTAQLAERFGVSADTIKHDLAYLGLRGGDLAGELYLHHGTWCVRCECGGYVPVCDPRGEDRCERCGRAYALRVVRR